MNYIYKFIFLYLFDVMGVYSVRKHIFIGDFNVAFIYAFTVWVKHNYYDGCPTAPLRRLNFKDIWRLDRAARRYRCYACRPVYVHNLCFKVLYMLIFEVKYFIWNRSLTTCGRYIVYL